MNKIAKLENALAVVSRVADKMARPVYGAMAAGIESQIQELRRQLRESEELKAADRLHLDSAEALGAVLIKGRVARGYTQRQLAEKLRLKSRFSMN